MKKVISGIELQEKMCEAILLLCGTVKETLGPKGNNVIIDHSNFSPFITNDGVTIALNIESEDEVVNTILKLAKEASIKTNEVVGDGTTTTLVLLESIFNEGIDLVKSGVNPITIKKELEQSIIKILPELEKQKMVPKKNDLKNIAIISSGDEKIGEIISDVFDKIKSKEAIQIKEGDDETKVRYFSGYKFDSITPSIYFFQDEKHIKYNNADVVIINHFLEDINEIANIINKSIENSKPLIIIAEDYSDEFTNDILSLRFERKIPVILLKSPGYGLKKRDILKDIEAICDCIMIENLDNITYQNIGHISSIEINSEMVCMYFDKNNNIDLRIKSIDSNINEHMDEIEKEELNLRKSMLSVGLAEILVGANTITEKREKKMRYDDAICAISQATDGIVLGCGLSFLQLADILDEEKLGDLILKKALIKPFKQCLINAGIDYEDKFNNIKEKGYSKIYNVKTEKYENVKETVVVDPLNVIRTSLMNAISIASMLLTTKSIVINEYQNNYAKINDYTEL